MLCLVVFHRGRDARNARDFEKAHFILSEPFSRTFCAIARCSLLIYTGRSAAPRVNARFGLARLGSVMGWRNVGIWVIFVAHIDIGGHAAGFGRYRFFI